MLAFFTKSDMFLRKLSQVASKFSTLGPPQAVKVEIERAERRIKLRDLDFLIGECPSDGWVKVSLSDMWERYKHPLSSVRRGCQSPALHSLHGYQKTKTLHQTADLPRVRRRGNVAEDSLWHA